MDRLLKILTGVVCAVAIIELVLLMVMCYIQFIAKAPVPGALVFAVLGNLCLLGIAVVISGYICMRDL